MAQLPVIGLMDGENAAYIVLVDEEETVQDLVNKVCHMVIDRRLPRVSNVYEAYCGDRKLPLSDKIKDAGITLLDRIDVKPVVS